MNPILLLEINEVPWRLIDRYIDDPRFPNLKIFFARSAQFTSVAVDSGELSPWVTWPSLHRGMSNEQHGVLDLGQDPATFRGTPIWKDMRDAGHSIGICGSMQAGPGDPRGKLTAVNGHRRKLRRFGKECLQVRESRIVDIPIDQSPWRFIDFEQQDRIHD